MRKRRSNSKASNSETKKRQPPIRLACASCDREDDDGVWRLPKDWIGIQKWQTLSDSLRCVEEVNSQQNLFEWYTHMGYCPECQELDS